MKKATLLVLTVSLAMVLCTDAFAGNKNGVDRAVESGFELRTHEIAAGGSFYPGHYGYIFGLRQDVDELSYTNTWWISYNYNFKKTFSLQVSLSYDGFTQKAIWEDAAEAVREFYISPMVTARFSWLNRRLVRMYSSVGIGIVFDMYSGFTDLSVGPAFQFTPIGISVGKKLYGYAELGVGSLYVLGCAGIGYRF